jgi:hypothetical protein
MTTALWIIGYFSIGALLAGFFDTFEKNGIESVSFCLFLLVWPCMFLIIPVWIGKAIAMAINTIRSKIRNQMSEDWQPAPIRSYKDYRWWWT